MRRFMSIAAAAIAATAGMGLAGPVCAQTFTPAGNASYTVDLDTQNGNFSVWRAKDLGGLNALRAKVVVSRLGKDSKWAPSFQIKLENANSHADLSIDGIKGLLFLHAQSWDGDKQVQDELFLMPPEVGETFGLELDWKADGSAVIVVHAKATEKVSGFERHEIKLSGAPSSLEVSGSTGEITLDPLQLGRVTP